LYVFKGLHFFLDKGSGGEILNAQYDGPDKSIPFLPAGGKVKAFSACAHSTVTHNSFTVMPITVLPC
jgi:hypothetical protein